MLRLAPRTQPKKLLSTATTSFAQAQSSERDITQMDLLKKKMELEKQEKETKKAKGQFWHEEKIAGETRKWNYRSEFVDRTQMDKPHTRIWASFGIIIVIGFSAFVLVKTQVVEGRKEQMKERERLRKQMTGSGVVA